MFLLRWTSKQRQSHQTSLHIQWSATLPSRQYWQWHQYSSCWSRKSISTYQRHKVTNRWRLEEEKFPFGFSIGGGTFLGLCCLLTGCSSYDEAIALATEGDSTKVNRLDFDVTWLNSVRLGWQISSRHLWRRLRTLRFAGTHRCQQVDERWEWLDRRGDDSFGSFGHMNLPDKREQASKADLARATLVTVLNNIGSISMMCARTEVRGRFSFSVHHFFSRTSIESSSVEVFCVSTISRCES